MKGSFSEKKRIILHVDMDHFFSAIEERENPNYKRKPVIVGADPREGKGRGVVKTCNYEAREFDIHSGMPISKAWRLCPNAIYVRANYRLYKKVSAEIMKILRNYSEKFQPWGFDEAFLNISSQVQDFDEAIELAVNIKHEILWNERLTCSVGIAPNKLVAKIACNFNKPDGLTVVIDNEVEKFLAPLSVRKMLWIGEKTENKLNEIGIKTIGDLAGYDVSVLIEKFGVMGARYHQWAHGIYKSEVGGRRRIRKSIGHESTFMANVNDQDLIYKKLENICQKVYERIIRRKLLFKTVTVKIRYGNFQTYTHGKTLLFFSNRLQDLQKTAQKLAQGFLCNNEKIRLMGVRVSTLKSSKGQRSLV